jgi:DNA polymerase-3 subunit delta'
MFSTIFGQEHIKEYIEHAHRDNRLAHTLLLSGKSGYGLFQVGKAIASFILCSNKTDDACGHCTNCNKVNDLQHPDLHVFFPTSVAKITTAHAMNDFRKLAGQDPYFDYSDWVEALGDANKSLNINKDIIKEINHAFSYKSFESGPRIYLIWGAEYLGKEGNKLLKVIEEPPEDAYVILMAEERQSILPTILSRCQSLLLKPLSNDDLLKTLNLESSEDNIKLTQLANGDIKRAQSAFSKSALGLHDLWLNYLRTAFKSHPTELIEKGAEIADQGKEFCRQFLHFGLSLISKMLKINMGIPIENDVALEKLAQLLTLEDLEAMSMRLQEDFVHINRNAHLKLLFASQSFWLSELFRKKKNSRVSA